jgi:hypothetical protein
LAIAARSPRWLGMTAAAAALLLIIVVGVIAIAVTVDLAALVGWLLRRCGHG